MLRIDVSGQVAMMGRYQMTNYKEAIIKLQKYEEFKGNTLSAWRNSQGEYRIYSYSTPIAIVDTYTNTYTYLNNHKYSVTTSKHQGLVCRAIGSLPLAKNCEIVD